MGFAHRVHRPRAIVGEELETKTPAVLAIQRAIVTQWENEKLMRAFGGKEIEMRKMAMFLLMLIQPAATR